ncbi:MAG: FkbM family methyltransferase [Candidatus Bathyarchaeia archaeon]
MRNLIAETYRILWRAPLKCVFGKDYILRLQKSKYVKAASSLEGRLSNYVVRTLKDFVQLKIPEGSVLGINDNGTLYYAYEIFMKGVYDKFHPPKKRDIVIDVGAHIGLFTLKVARRVRLVVAVEPHPINFYFLTSNIKTNHLENVIPMNIALSNFSGITKLYFGKFSGSHTIMEDRVKDTNRFILVKVETLDDIVQKLGLKGDLFVKIDVEGAELRVLEGARKVLQRSNVHLSIAAYHTQSEALEIAKFLSRLGFRVRIYSAISGAFIYADK